MQKNENNSGWVVEALKTLGKNNIDENIVAVLKNKLNAEEKREVLWSSKYKKYFEKKNSGKKVTVK